MNNWGKPLKEHRRGKSSIDEYLYDFYDRNGQDLQKMASVDDGEGIVFAGSDSSRNNNTFLSEGHISYARHGPRVPRLRSVTTHSPIPEVREKGSMFYQDAARSRQNSEPRWKNSQFSSR